MGTEWGLAGRKTDMVGLLLQKIHPHRMHCDTRECLIDRTEQTRDFYVAALA